MYWTATGAILLALGVMLGAFGAHALRARLDAYLMSVYERAVFYHFVHALGLLVVSLLPRIGALGVTATTWVCALLLAGVVLFSGSLYALAITGSRGFGAITPIGGLSFIAAWLFLAVTLIRGFSARP
jgi:uncharacterized membrane protein YgdD (TMEM256/DUF423 family)